MVLLLRESGSLFWYLVYLFFLPGAVTVGAHVALLGFSIGLPSGGFRPSGLATLALIGSTGGPLLTASLSYFRLAPGFVPAIASTSLAIACDSAL